MNYRKWVRNRIVRRDRLGKIVNFSYNLYCKINAPFHKLPDFLIIGAEKCGTTSLFQYIIEHPDVYSGRGKEIYFFDKQYFKGIHWYKLFFPVKTKNIFQKNTMISGEATPRCLNHPLAPKRIKKIMPNVKLIVLLRNPIDRAYSHYQMEHAYGRDKLSFEESIRIENNRIQGEFQKMEEDGTYYSPKFYWYSHLTSGIYWEQLERWFKYFPRKQFLIIQSEELFEKPSEVYNQALEFLGLHSHELKEYKKFRSREYEGIEKKEKQELEDFFRPHNEKLYQMLGKKFSW